ncbi:hypothetical protein DXG03_008058 [Asterophora parasitica]|uniref:Uncharacterized protein n=1 Tax=Asterophora parasitica TaxID=117018 RepID=A0A9P7K6V1_9AGAR|nr:hypothetical protein DXG03_008058 [Asterophora parasitica]
MSSPAVPLKSARIAALSIAWAWAIVSSGTGLNALIESHRAQSALKAKAPPPTRLDINVSDATNSGIVLTTGSVLVGVLTYNMVVGMFFPATRDFINRTLRTQGWLLTFHIGSPGTADATNSGIVLTTGSVLVGVLTYNMVVGMFFPATRDFINRTLRTQGWLLTFCSVWLFACAVPFTYIFANRSAIVRAFIGDIELPHSVIEAMQKQGGTSSEYKTMSYLRWVAIFPWITILFTSIAALVLFRASNHVSAAPILVNESVSSVEEKEKATEEREERVEDKA